MLVAIIRPIEVCRGVPEPPDLEDRKTNQNCSNVQFLDAMEMVILQENIFRTEGC